MDTLNKRRLLNDLKDPESRQLFYAEHIATALPIQIRELRKQRKMNQTKLAKLIGTDQTNISDWENPNYAYKPQLGTLMRLADAFDVPLIVRFGSWEELWDWENNLSLKRLAPREFKEALPDLEKMLSEQETARSNQTKGSLTLIKGTDAYVQTARKGKSKQEENSSQTDFLFHVQGLPRSPVEDIPPVVWGTTHLAANRR